MKKSIFISCIVLLASLSTNLFAAIKISEDNTAPLPPYIVSDPSISGQIRDASYVYINGKPLIFVQLSSKTPNTSLVVEFTDADLPLGLAAASSIDKEMIIYFANAKYDIEQITIAHNYHPSISNMPVAHRYNSKKY